MLLKKLDKTDRIILLTFGAFVLGSIIISLSPINVRPLRYSPDPQKEITDAEENLRKKTAELVAQGWASSLPHTETQAILTGTVVSSHGRADGKDVFLIRHNDVLYQCEMQRQIASVSDPSGAFYPPISGPELRRSECWKLS
jgi:hypothetical protein